MGMRAMTPYQVANIWGCSPNHVRNLINRGELRAFRLGKRLFRIPAEAIGEYEKCQMNTELDASKDDTSLPGGSTASGAVIVLTHSPERKPRAKQST